jgi:hypothetical protein
MRGNNEKTDEKQDDKGSKRRAADVSPPVDACWLSGRIPARVAEH